MFSRCQPFSPFLTTTVNRSSPSGASAAPILVFLGIVALSVIFFFVFTLPQCSGRQTTVTSLPASPSTPAVPVTPVPPPALETTPPPPTVVTPPKPFYMKSSQFLAALFEQLRTGKIDEARELMVSSVPQPKQDFFQKLFTTAGYHPASEGGGWQEVGRISGQERWLLPLAKSAVSPAPLADPTLTGIGLTIGAPTPIPAAAAAAAASPEISIDLKLTRDEGYQITGLHFSPSLLAAESATADRSLVDPPDPLSISHDFVAQVLGKNFKGARGITDGTKVTHEKLAGLCIVFEEGDYHMVPGSSLNVTAANNERAWALVRVKSPTQNVASEFGVEMAKNAQNEWKVDSLDFSKLLQNYVQATGAGNVYYTPIVKNPNGGESLVVYFEYDKSELTGRGLRQMEIVADLLKSDPARKMRLGGYTDSLGTDDYNAKLSKKRAEAVRNKLAELGVPAAQIVTHAYGAEAPLDPNKKDDGTDNPEGRSRNRRTEIYLDF